MSTKTNAEVPSRHVRSQIAAIAEVEERSVQRFFVEPERLRPVVKRAIEKALEVYGARP